MRCVSSARAEWWTHVHGLALTVLCYVVLLSYEGQAGAGLSRAGPCVPSLHMNLVFLSFCRPELLFYHKKMIFLMLSYFNRVINRSRNDFSVSFVFPLILLHIVRNQALVWPAWRPLSLKASEPEGLWASGRLPAQAALQSMLGPGGWVGDGGLCSPHVPPPLMGLHSLHLAFFFWI